MPLKDWPEGQTPPDAAETAHEIAVAASLMSAKAHAAGLDIVARLLNLVRIEAEIRLSQVKFRPPGDSPASSNRCGRS